MYILIALRLTKLPNWRMAPNLAPEFQPELKK